MKKSQSVSQRAISTDQLHRWLIAIAALICGAATSFVVVACAEGSDNKDVPPFVAESGIMNNTKIQKHYLFDELPNANIGNQLPVQNRFRLPIIRQGATVFDQLEYARLIDGIQSAMHLYESDPQCFSIHSSEMMTVPYFSSFNPECGTRDIVSIFFAAPINLQEIKTSQAAVPYALAIKALSLREDVTAEELLSVEKIWESLRERANVLMDAESQAMINSVSGCSAESKTTACNTQADLALREKNNTIYHFGTITEIGEEVRRVEP